MSHPETAPAIRIDQFGGPEVLRLVEAPVREPGPGEALVRLSAIGVNPADTKVRQGKRHSGPLTEAVGLGSDAAGVIEAVGAGVASLHPGDEVIGRGLTAAYASYLTAPVARFSSKPAGVSFAQGAALGIPVGTAWQVLASLGLSGAHTLLVHAGAGAVGQAAIQLARLQGARVIATASEGNHELLRELGAEPVAYGDGLLERVRQLAPGGVDRVLDGVGTQEALEASLALVRDPAHIGEIVNVAWAGEYGVSAFSGSRPGYLSDEQKAIRAQAVPYAAELIAAGRFRVEIVRTLPLAEAADAHRLVEDGHVAGKIVLTP